MPAISGLKDVKLPELSQNQVPGEDHVVSDGDRKILIAPSFIDSDSRASGSGGRSCQALTIQRKSIGDTSPMGLRHAKTNRIPCLILSYSVLIAYLHMNPMPFTSADLYLQFNSKQDVIRCTHILSRQAGL